MSYESNLPEIDLTIRIKRLKPTQWTGEPGQKPESEIAEVREFKSLTPLEAAKKILDYVHEY